MREHRYSWGIRRVVYRPAGPSLTAKVPRNQSVLVRAPKNLVQLIEALHCPGLDGFATTPYDMFKMFDYSTAFGNSEHSKTQPTVESESQLCSEIPSETMPMTPPCRLGGQSKQV